MLAEIASRRGHQAVVRACVIEQAVDDEKGRSQAILEELHPWHTLPVSRRQPKPSASCRQTLHSGPKQFAQPLLEGHRHISSEAEDYWVTRAV